MIKYYSGTAMTAAILAVTSGAQAQTLGEDAAAFGARQTISDIALSPSGNKVLFVEPGNGSDETIYVVDLSAGTEPRALVTTNEAQARLSGCNWGSEEMILCRVYGYVEAGGLKQDFTRLLSVDSSDGEVRDMSPRVDYRTRGAMQDGGSLVALDVEGEDGKVLLTRTYIKQDSTNTRLYNDEEGLGVDLVDLRTGRRVVRERPSKQAVGYRADENGNIRMQILRSTEAAGRYEGDDLRYMYRPLDSKGWEQLSEANDRGQVLTGFAPVAVESSNNVAYGFENIGGYTALVSQSLDGNNTRRVLLQRDDVDVDSLVRIGRQRRVVGVSYATEKRYVEYFDEELAKFAESLAKALPGRPQVSIVDASEDESTLLLIASSDTDPGMVYLYDKPARQLQELLPLRAPLEGRAMGEMQPVTFPAADGTQIPAYLTLPPGSDGKNLPAVVMPHGGPGARDEWGFDWMVQFLAARGYAVLQPNFRGSAGYGDAWFGRNGFQAWETAVGDVNSAGRWLVQQGIASADKLAISGWSYGGYAALQSQVLDPSLYKAVVAIAPVADLGQVKEDARSYTSFARVNDFIGSGPHIESGSPARHAARFQAPTLLVHGTMDLNVDVNQSKLMEDRLKAAGKQVDYLEFEGLDHGLVHTQARGIMLRRIGEFLAASLGTE